MNVLISENFEEGYGYRSKGDGLKTLRADNRVVNLKAGSDGSSVLFWNIPVKEGDIIEFEVTARRIAGDPRISFDLMNKDGQFIQSAFVWESIKETGFKNYKIKMQVPHINSVETISITMGAWNRVKVYTEGEYMFPRLKVSSSYGSLQTIATGNIQIRSGEPIVNERFKHFGVKSLAISEDNKKIIVGVYNGNTHEEHRQRPLVFVSGTNDYPEVATAGKWSDTDKTFEVQFTNGTDFITFPDHNYYFFFEVKG